MNQATSGATNLHPRRILLTAAATLFTAASLFAQAHPGGSSGGGMQQQNTQQGQNGVNSDQVSFRDQDFLRKAMEGGQTEIELSKLALQKSQSDDVKQFAQKMVDDHTQMGTNIQPIAHQMGVEPPKKLPKKSQQLIAKMQGLSGSDFDTAYINTMASDHTQVLKDFSAEAASTQDPNIKAFITQSQPTVQGHLEAIQTVAKNHNVTLDPK